MNFVSFPYLTQCLLCGPTAISSLTEGKTPVGNLCSERHCSTLAEKNWQGGREQENLSQPQLVAEVVAPNALFP